MPLRPLSHVNVTGAAPIVSHVVHFRDRDLIPPLGIESALCREGNVVSSKMGAQIVIMGILNMPIDEIAIPDQDFTIVDSIVEAEPVRAEGNVQLELYADPNETQLERL